MIFGRKLLSIPKKRSTAILGHLATISMFLKNYGQRSKLQNLNGSSLYFLIFEKNTLQFGSKRSKLQGVLRYVYNHTF